ncbi:MAG TPA: SCO family protein, partial [Polyangia bacterium]|nr:SCO family protein [Polyangia bacterium]
GAAPALALPSFRARDQEGRIATEAELRGRVTIVDFIFTRCAGVCPTLTARLMSLRRELAGDRFRFVSFSVDPEHDTPEVLRDYAARWTSDPERWRLLAADQDTLARIGSALHVPASAPMHADRFSLLGPDLAIHGSFAVAEPGGLARLASAARALEGRGPALAPSRPDGAESLLVLGCLGCHAEPRLAPPLASLAGSRVRLASGATVVADEAYLRRSILAPGAELVAGYGPSMPSYALELAPPEVDALIEALEAPAAGAGGGPRSQPTDRRGAPDRAPPAP